MKCAWCGKHVIDDTEKPCLCDKCRNENFPNSAKTEGSAAGAGKTSHCVYRGMFEH